jgi:hypothetical protein
MIPRPAVRSASPWLLAGATLAGLALASGTAGAQAPEPWVLYGHDSRTFRTVAIDTTNGLARPIGDTGFDSTGAGLETSSGPVPSQGGVVYPKDTAFGVFRDNTFNKDYVIVLDNVTGKAVKTVELDLGIGGRGVGFGPDGTTLYAYTGPGTLFTIDTVTGALETVGEVWDENGTRHTGVSLQYDPISGDFLALTGGSDGPGSATLIRIDPATANAIVIGPVPGLTACTITRVPGPVAGPNGKVYPAGTFFTINTQTNTLHALEVDTVGLQILSNDAIGPLGPNATQICATSFSLEYTPWATPSEPTPPAVGTPTAPPEVTATLAPPTPTATSGTPAPTPIFPTCICSPVLRRVPAVIVQDAVANPTRYFGWLRPLDPGKPSSPANPLRMCLTLPNVNIDYHPLWNRPMWKVGCG